MKLIIAGSRDLKIDKMDIAEFIQHLNLEVTEVVCGCARGVDTAGFNWAKVFKIPVKHFPANWTTLGKSAGYQRNVEMAEYADALLLVWDGLSKGSKHMKEIMERKEKPIYLNIVEVDQKV